MNRFFGGLRMTWLRVLIFSVITGVYTGLIMLVPALEDTSFQDIGISYECWVIFALIIVTNCDRWYGAALKCFVFFLISQPLVYLTEIVFGDLSFSLAWTYYYSMWLPLTILTLPGGLIAYFSKQQKWYGAVILGLGNTIQTVMGCAYLGFTLRSFPHHLLTVLLCFASVIWMTVGIQKDTKNRIISLALPVVLTVLIAVAARMSGRVFI